MQNEEIVAALDALIRRLEEVEQAQLALQAKLAAAETEREKAAAEREEAAAEREHYRALYLEMLERCRKLEKGLSGPKSERLSEDQAQLTFDVLAMLLTERELADIDALAEAGAQEVKGHTRKKPTGRKPLPENLPRVEIKIIPDEVEREGLDAFECIGEDVTEVLERRPASVVVVRIIKRKFVRKNRDEKKGVLMGETPELPIPRGLAGPGMLSDTIVKRWDDHAPLNRLERIYARDGIELARSTICQWHKQLVMLFAPLVAAMRLDAFNAPYVCVDATGVLVLQKEKCRRSHFWVLVVPGRHVLFEYTREHTNDAVDTVLAGYQGYIVADAHVVYDHLYVDENVTEVNCWAHARRYFFNAMGSDPERARRALAMINALFKIERSIADKPPRKKERLRKKHSAPIVERFFSWCDAEWPQLLEDTPIYDGVRYSRNQRAGLTRFLGDGRLPVDNNISERELRRQAVGRKNWLFLGSDDGGHTNAIFTSLIASCRMTGVEPWAYLRDLMCLMPRWPKHDVLELAPINWAETAKRDDVQAKLAADPYRAATLDLS